ncbi:hypothetical protein WS68_03820 [Burkholderia sp. TSV86]|nr:hypothetical protein WS68_03820 [Burkholderia sp. TSV86]
MKSAPSRDAQQTCAPNGRQNRIDRMARDAPPLRRRAHAYAHANALSTQPVLFAAPFSHTRLVDIALFIN